MAGRLLPPFAKEEGPIVKTYRMLMAQILSEVTGRDQEYVNQVIDLIDIAHPGKRREIAISDEEYEAKLAEMRREKAGILNWLLAGAAKAKARGLS